MEKKKSNKTIKIKTYYCFDKLIKILKRLFSALFTKSIFVKMPCFIPQTKSPKGAKKQILNRHYFKQTTASCFDFANSL